MSLTTTIEIRAGALLAHVARSPLLKRTVDMLGALAALTLLAPIFLVTAIAIKMEVFGSRALPSDADREKRRSLHHGEVPVDARRSRRSARKDAGRNGVPPRDPVQEPERPAHHADRPVHPPILDRRASAVLERAHWRHVARRPAPGAPVGSGEVCHRRPRSSAREARHHLPVAGWRTRQNRLRWSGGARSQIRPRSIDLPRSLRFSYAPPMPCSQERAPTKPAY